MVGDWVPTGVSQEVEKWWKEERRGKGGREKKKNKGREEGQ